MENKERLNLYMCNAVIAKHLEKLSSTKFKVFKGREWFLNSGEIIPELPENERFDYIFMTAESLKKYFFHPIYCLDLKKILIKYGMEETKIVVFSCNNCWDCNNFVRDNYKDLNIDFLHNSNNFESMSKEIMKKYFLD